jgi:hypothetical protein
MDDFSVRLSDDMICLLTAARVRATIFAPHTTQIFQVFVFTIFGVAERCPSYELPFDSDHATVKVITKVYHDFT